MLRKTYKITWKQWDASLDKAAKDFHDKTGVYPNVLLASTVTFNRINLVANSQEKGKKIRPSTYIDVSGFVGDGYTLMFAVRDQTPESHFALLYDTDPGGGGEPWPDEDTVSGEVSLDKRRERA